MCNCAAKSLRSHSASAAGLRKLRKTGPATRKGQMSSAVTPAQGLRACTLLLNTPITSNIRQAAPSPVISGTRRAHLYLLRHIEVCMVL
jgi:hypothetical protein